MRQTEIEAIQISTIFGKELMQVRWRNAVGLAAKPTGWLALSDWFQSGLNVNQSGHNACSSEGNPRVYVTVDYCS